MVGLDVRDGVASAGYSVKIDGVRNADQICDASVAILVNAMRQFCGGHWRPDRVYLMSEPPPDLNRFARFFAAPVEYRSAKAWITFDSAVLDCPVKVQDPAYREIMTPILEKAIESTGGDFLAAVKSILKSHAGRITLDPHGGESDFGGQRSRSQPAPSFSRSDVYGSCRAVEGRTRTKSSAQGKTHQRHIIRPRFRRRQLFHPDFQETRRPPSVAMARYANDRSTPRRLEHRAFRLNRVGLNEAASAA